MALRWKKNPRPTGLRSITAGEQGSTLRDGDEVYAYTQSLRNQHRTTTGWFWYARNDDAGVPRMNTSENAVPDETTAKAAALAYVRKHLSIAKEASKS